jgi:hypothetical protein
MHLYGCTSMFSGIKVSLKIDDEACNGRLNHLDECFFNMESFDVDAFFSFFLSFFFFLGGGGGFKNVC